MALPLPKILTLTDCDPGSTLAAVIEDVQLLGVMLLIIKGQIQLVC